MKSGSIRFGRAFLVIVFLLAGCNIPQDTGEIQTQTMAALATTVAETQAALAVPTTQPTVDNPVPPTETIPPPPEPTATQQLPPTATAIVHKLFPAEPGALGYWIYDRENESTAGEKRAGGSDAFFSNLFERPFTSQEMAYRPDVDIIRADLTLDTNFIYILITLQGANPATGTLSAVYAVELDTDLDGRGDFTFWAFPPFTTQWDTLGVRGYTDTNNDVGGKVPLNADTPPYTGDSYDKLIFSVEIPGDPDLAWARISPANPAQIQIAFKKSAINSATFLWGVIADDGWKAPDKLDYNDQLTLAEAGSPLISLAEYPLKNLALVDNTCRIAQGFTPTGSEPGICLIPTPTPTEPVRPGIIRGRLFMDNNADGAFNGTDTNWYGPIRLGSGACPSTGMAAYNTLTGFYAFTNLTPGTYCVSHDIPYTPTTPRAVTVVLGNGETRTVDFGLKPIE